MSKEDMGGKWVLSLNGEDWSGLGYLFDSKEEAIDFVQQQVREHGWTIELVDNLFGSDPYEEMPQTVYVGKARGAGLPLSVDDIIEQMQESAYEESEYAESYLDNMTTEAKKGLGALISLWFQSHPEYLPDWFTVEDITEFSVTI